MKKKILPLLFGILLIGLWTITTQSGSLMPSPNETIMAFKTLFTKGYGHISIFNHFAISMYRLFTATLMAILIGVPLGLISGYFKTIRVIVEPYINFYKPLPPLSYYVLLIMFLGINESSKIMLLFLAGFAPIYVACTQAFLSVNDKYIRHAKSLGASNYYIFKTVILPASLPQIMTGIATALAVAYTTLASAEMIAATSGLGWIVMDAYNYLKTDIVIAVIFIMGITGIVLEKMLKLIDKRFIFWKGKL